MSQLVPNFNLPEFEDNFLTMYTDWNSYDVKPSKPSLEFQLDGLNSGVPTRTTPTLTPTTLRNIEQTFMELQSEAESHQNEAGFVPPLVQPTTTNSSGGVYMSIVDTKSWQGGSTTVSDIPSSVGNLNNVSMASGNSSLVPMHVISSSASTSVTLNNSNNNTSINNNNNNVTTKRNIGGRRPNKENGISFEEEERRKLRRERNKLAAARCRKRRLDHTNELVEETEGLEEKKKCLQDEIQQLHMHKEELELLLEAHESYCRLRRSISPEDIKPFASNNNNNLHHQQQQQQQRTTGLSVTISSKNEGKQNMLTRPNSLPINNNGTYNGGKNSKISQVTGISITTPSSGITLNFDSLLEGGTGLTPLTGALTPSCSTQLRNLTGIDLSSPDSLPSKLVSL